MGEQELPEKMTYGEKYGPAMEMTDPTEASAYFEKCVRHAMKYHGSTREEAEQNEKGNLGYYAGYYGNETRQRVQKLFCCAHPSFGAIDEGAPRVINAFKIGQEIGKAATRVRDEN